MSQIGDLLDAWLECHIEFGTLVGREWTPQPASEQAIEDAIKSLGGPKWPDELVGLYRWAGNGCRWNLFPFGTLAPLESTAELSPDIGYQWDEAGRAEEGFVNPYPILISIEYPCTFVDREGEAPRKLWANDVGSIFEMATSLTEYVETCVRMTQANEMQRDPISWGLTFRDHDGRWGPAAQS